MYKNQSNKENEIMRKKSGFNKYPYKVKNGLMKRLTTEKL